MNAHRRPVATTLRSLVVPALVALSSSACDDHDHDHDHGGEDAVAEELCFHMANGPEQAISLPDLEGGEEGNIGQEHTRFDITLLLDEGNRFGTVQYPVAEAGEYVFALSADVPLVVFDADNARVEALSEMVDTSACASDIATTVVYDLDIGTYTISFGPTSTELVSVVVERHDGDHDHDGHDH